jgi:hypothetical protein
VVRKKKQLANERQTRAWGLAMVVEERSIPSTVLTGAWLVVAHEEATQAQQRGGLIQQREKGGYTSTRRDSAGYLFEL